MDEVSVRYGALVAVNRVSVEIPPGRIVSVVGPNGAGKSTLLAVASGVRRPHSGGIRLGNTELGGGCHRFARAGIRRTFQTPRVMAEASVLENVLVGTHASVRTNFLSDACDTTTRFARSLEQRGRAIEAVERVGLGQHLEQLAGTLPYGHVRLLELARGLAGEPSFLLLDEPAAGLNDEETSSMGALLRDVASSDGVGVILVEHNLGLVTAISDEVTVLNFGSVIASGQPAEVVADPAVIEAYTGSSK